MKHKHHIIPKHMGGDDSKENLIELSIEEHALEHKKLWEMHGHQEDYLAWQGLSGLMAKEELVRELLKMAGRKGAEIANRNRWGEIKKTHKKTGYLLDVDGRKIRTKRYWFNNGTTEGQYSLDNHPEGWTRGRLKSVMIKTNPFVHL
jgi:hypothetical protein